MSHDFFPVPSHRGTARCEGRRTVSCRIRSLVDGKVVEDFDLDFKGTLYGRSDSEKRDLAGDVAAMANTAGGVVILGVVDDEQDRAVDAPGVDISGGETRRMLQIIASGVSPMPHVEILTVPLTEDAPADGDDPRDGEATERGYYVITIPRSRKAPHAVLVDKGLRYPRRNGSTTYYLSEAEVEAAYRDRITGLDEQWRRLGTIEDEARERIIRRERPWVMVSLVPDLAGEFEISSRTKRQFSQVTIGAATHEIDLGVQFQRVTVGKKRLIACGSSDGWQATYALAEYHSDGSGSYALELFDLRATQQAGLGNAQAASSQLVDDELLVISVLTGLRRLAAHARDRAAAGGNALVRLRLLPSPSRALEIGHTRQIFRDSRSDLAVTDDVAPADTVAALDDLADPGPALVSSAARLIDEIGQVFGIPEMGQLGPDGEIRIRYFASTFQPRVRAWAEHVGVVVTDNTLND